MTRDSWITQFVYIIAKDNGWIYIFDEKNDVSAAVIISSWCFIDL